jgi:dephospho-CoA kinase
MERDSIEHDMALEKISSQMPAEEKLNFADYVIDTSGPLRHTLENAEQVYRNLMIDYEIKSSDGA